jgi:hypothetical protein
MCIDDIPNYCIVDHHRTTIHQRKKPGQSNSGNSVLFIPSPTDHSNYRKDETGNDLEKEKLWFADIAIPMSKASRDPAEDN